MEKRKIYVIAPFKERHIVHIKEAAGENFLVVHLEDDQDEERIKEALKDAEIIIGQPKITLLQEPEKNCPNLKLIQTTWAGIDQYTRSKLPFPYDRVKLLSGSGAYGMIISQFVIGQILTLMLNFKQYHNQQNQKIWERKGPIKSLEQARVLVFGAGDIGTTTAKRLTGFDTYTIGVCRNASGDRPYFNELCTLKQAEKYLPTVDVIICCMPNTEETEGYLNKKRMKLIKKDAIIVNVGRGNFIDCMALDELLKDGHLWGAALDVTNPEPLPIDHPLWNNSRCMITPHSSGMTFGYLDATEDLVCKVACQSILKYRDSKLM